MAKVFAKFPPNYQDIIKALPAVKRRPNCVFTYYPHIYHPAGGQLSQDLMKHEAIHLLQQHEMGPEAWWAQYLADPQFRLMQEMEAYQAQYQAIANYNRAQRRSIINKIAADLSSSMYGNVLTKAEAIQGITGAY